MSPRKEAVAQDAEGPFVAGQVLDPDWRKQATSRIRRWYRQHARDLPWRQTKDPYAIWVSEIMLQQTQVATVIPYYERFLQRFPDVRQLAAAQEQEVLRYWEGLGYYRRGRQLHAAARRIVETHSGRFPTDPQEVYALPGIGRYTAHAILSIATGQRLPILEANTIRLYARLLACREDPTRHSVQQQLWSFAQWWLPQREAGTFNQALMEVGSLICTPRQPRCLVCPLRDLCPTRQAGLQEQIPIAKQKVQYEAVEEAAAIIAQRGRLLLRRCAADERWAGLWDFPRLATQQAAEEAQRRELEQLLLTRYGIAGRIGRRLTVIKHGVTRFRIRLSGYEATIRDDHHPPTNANLRWIPLNDLEELPLSTTGRKLGRLVLEQLS